MAKNVLKYKKGTSIREESPQYVERASTKLKNHSLTPIITQQKIPVSYSKTDGVLSYNIICVISGGSVRERDFLVEIEKKHTFKKIYLKFITSNQGGLTPNMMQNEYSKICKNGCILIDNRSIILDEVDKIYMVTDVDHYERELKNILKRQKDSELPKWIISNPCFEIWIYYCYRNNPQEDLKDILNTQPSSRSSLLKTINGNFNNGGGLDPRKAFEHLNDGISNSRKFYQETDGLPDLLSTQMHIFAEDILEILGKEYSIWLERTKQSRIQFKNRY